MSNQALLEHERSEEVPDQQDLALDSEADEFPKLEMLPRAPLPVVRLGVLSSLGLLAAGTMVGGIFAGIAPRAYAAIAGVIGVLIATATRNIKRSLVATAVALAALLLTGLLLVLPSGFSDVSGITGHVAQAAKSGAVLRPPVLFDVGWRAILVWIMSGLGFAAAWAALELRRPSLGLLVPLPVVAFAAISVPKGAQVPSGMVCLAIFGVALGVLSSIDLEVGEKEIPSLAYEGRRALRALPILAGVTLALFFLSRSNLLFPAPLIDPTQEAQKPKAVPLGEVEDRVLFTVKSSISGPWRMGLLDVYDGRDWRLPPFAESRLKEIPKSGVIDGQLEPGVKATFEVRGLEGAVLPGLPNLVGVVATGDLIYDARTGNIRVRQGQIGVGDSYTVTAARLPTVEELQQINDAIPGSIQRFLEIPDPPPVIEDLLRRAPSTSAWDRMDFARQELLATVVATGAGTPVSVSPSRVEDMLAGTKHASPFEIVAAEAMLARWAGVPSRIGYGFDGGEKTREDTYEVRPRHGATFLEVYFPRYNWLPVLGTPRQAKSSLGSDQKQFNASVVPSNEIAVELYLPTVRDPENLLFQQIRRVLFTVLPILLVLLTAYYLYPLFKKTRLRSKRRTLAYQLGITARIALAYAEWRDLATDFGHWHETDTPLMFLQRAVDDSEHSTLAWLVTRSLWGDLQSELDEDDALNAEELSRALRKRFSQSHPWTLRVIAALSRMSLRHPYAANFGSSYRSFRERLGRESKAA